MKKYLAEIFAAVYVLVAAATIAKATWDTTTPADTEAASLGAQRIRELKTDIQTALGRSGVFPGSDTANPNFYTTLSSWTMPNRPTGISVTTGSYGYNSTSHTLEEFNGSTWSVVNIVPPQVKFPLAYDIGGSTLAILIDTNTFGIKVGTTTQNPATSTYTMTGGTLTLAIGSPGLSRFRASVNTSMTPAAISSTIFYGTEALDSLNEFNGTTFTATTAGTYFFHARVNATMGQVANYCQMQLITTGNTFNSFTSSTTNKCTAEITQTVELNANDNVTTKIANGATTTNFTLINGDDTGSSTISMFEGFKLR